MDKPNGHHREPAPPAIIPAEIPQFLTLERDPETVIAEARRAAKALAELVKQKEKPVIINDEIYLEYEDWQMLGRFFQISAAVVTGSTKTFEIGEVIGFEASAEALLLIDGRTVRVSAAEAMCLNDEYKWGDKPLFQLRSMAQTRACAKALRNVLAWIVVLAGFRPTPAEELDSEKSPEIRTPQRRSEPERVPAPETQRPPDRERRPQSQSPRRYQSRYDHIHGSREHRPSHDRPAPQPPRSRRDQRFISDKQLNRMLAIARDAHVSRSTVNQIADHYGFRDLQDITRDYYDDICDRIYKAGE